MNQQIEQVVTFLRARNDSPHTLRGYHSDLLALSRRARQSAIGKVNGQDVRAFLRDLHQQGVAPASQIRKLHAVPSFFEWLASHELVAHDVSNGDCRRP
jgi:integrase/recombinase XerC